MNNVKSLSIILLLSLGVATTSYTKGRCDTDCRSDRDCGSKCSIDRCGKNDCGDRCDDCGDSCNGGCNSDCRTSTFFRARPISTNLTYRNNGGTFFDRHHDAACNFFVWDSAFIYQQSRREECLGVGFFGANPLTFGERGDVDVNSINFGLGITTEGESFESSVFLCPERKVFAWLPQFYFNLDCFCTGLWTDVSFAVVSVRHDLRVIENLESNEGNIPDEATTVRQALLDANVFSARALGDCRETGVDDVVFRLGYDYNYCADDYLGIYFLGIAPAGKSFDNSRWFQPLTGSKHGAVGAGFTMDYSVWCDECNNSDVTLQTELMYQYRLRHDELRAFDLNNGALSRFLLVTDQEDNNNNPMSNLDNLITCVRVEPRHQIEWWINAHYTWCNWGAEFSYNLWWRDCERIKDCPIFDFNGLGIYDQTRCEGLTSNSNATIGDQTVTGDPNLSGTPDAEFTPLTTADVDLCSGVAQRVLSHTISGAVSYNNVWCDCYPVRIAFGGGYEFVSKKKRRHAPENWHIYAKWGLSY